MPIPDTFLAPISIIHQRLCDLPHLWAITGSLGMALQGMDLDPRDIDLQTTREGTYAIQQALSEFVTRPVYKRESQKIRSYFAEMEIGGVKVEVMGEMQHRALGGEWTEAADLSMIIRRAEFRGMALPALDLTHEVNAYRRMGRVEKAARIQHFIDSQSKNDV